MKKIISLALLTTCIIGCNKNSESSSLNNTSSYLESNSVTSVYQPKEDDKVHLIILAGQSGGRGKALINDLSDEYKQPNSHVDIIADGLIMESLNNIPESFDDNVYFSSLEPGLGDYPTEFGPEIGIGETLASRYKKENNEYKSIIIKYTACGSTFTNHWYSESLYQDEEISQYLNIDQVRTTKNNEDVGPLTNNLYQLIDYTVEMLAMDGYEVIFDGATFIHGEQDAKFDDNMLIYEKALAYFIKDLRDYIGDNDLPFVITEALTNSAKYSNELRNIQSRVSNNVSNVTLIKTSDLYTNTFEPWHFGAQSNIVLGNRIAAELISHNDTRIVKSMDGEIIDVPFGVNVSLPQYVKASFTNNMAGYLKVNKYLTSYDCQKLGEQDVKFESNTGEGIVEYSIKVNVDENVTYVDGILNEYSNSKKNILPNNLGEIYVTKGSKGLYISSKINDSEIWTDGENWHKGDMGQKGNNDDLIIYLTDSTIENRYTICLSSANLLRVYDKGIGLSDTDYILENNNLYYNKKICDFNFHVTTYGISNDNSNKSEGMSMELYISYNDLKITDPNEIKLCFNYNNISFNSEKICENNYLVKNVGNEENIESYFNINELI